VLLTVGDLNFPALTMRMAFVILRANCVFSGHGPPGGGPGPVLSPGLRQVQGAAAGARTMQGRIASVPCGN
jgi:hypothetical protein